MIRYGKLEANYVDRADAYKARMHLPKCPRCHYPMRTKVCVTCADTRAFDTSTDIRKSKGEYRWK